MDWDIRWMDTIGGLLASIAGLLDPLRPVFKLFSDGLLLVANVLKGVVDVITWAWNAICDIVSFVTFGLVKLPKMGSGSSGTSSSASSSSSGSSGGAGSSSGGSSGSSGGSSGGTTSKAPQNVSWLSREELWAAGFSRGDGTKGIYVPGIGTIFTASKQMFYNSVLGVLTDAQARSVWASAPAAAKGGIIPRPTMVLAGEAGPEAIIPLERFSRYPLGDITINNIVTLDGEVVYRSVQRRAAKDNMRSGYNLPGVPA